MGIKRYLQRCSFQSTSWIRSNALRRPQNRFEELRDLFLVGGGTHPGSGLPTIFESGRISAKLICSDLGIEPDWNGVETWFEDIKKPKIKTKMVV